MKIKITITDYRKNIFFEILLLLYFIFIFAHNAVPYVKFMLWIAIVAVGIANSLRICSPESKKNLVSSALWMIPFFAWIWISQFWAVFPGALESTTIYETMLRIVVVVMAIALYCNTYEKCISVLKIFGIAVLYTILLAIATSPVSTYGKNTFGGIVTLHRNNIGAIAAIVTFLSFYAYNMMQKRKLYILSMCIGIVGTFITGSRGAVISLVFMFGLYVIFIDGLQKKIKYGVAVLVALIVGLYLISTIPFLNQYFGERLLSVFSEKYSDMSVFDRNYYVVVGVEMIGQKPLIGWGPNSFAVYLNKFGGYGREVYSHNNYIELMANYGIVGLSLYYWAYIYMLRKSWKNRNDIFGKLLLILLMRFIICDYQSIVYLEYDLMFFLAIMISISNLLRENGSLVNGRE